MHDASIGRQPPAASRRGKSYTRGHVMAVTLRRKGALTIQQVHSLIENVKSYPCIWNQTHEEYIHRSTIAVAWNEIAKKIQLPEDVIRAKWKNLRDLFMRESKRTKVTSVDDYHGKWRHFKKLWFLYRMDASEQVLSEDEGSETTDVFESPQEPYEVKIEPTDAEVNQFVFLDTEQEVNEILPEKQKSDRDDLSDIFSQAPKRRRMNQAYTDGDCDMMFLMSLTPYFKLLKPIRKLVVRNKMQDIILKEIERTTVNGQL